MSKTNQSDHSASEFQFPNSERIYVAGTRPGIQVPMRELYLNPTRSVNGAVEQNEPVRLYDTTGPWGDRSMTCSVNDGLPALRREWIIDRGDVEEYEGRDVLPQDDGYLTEGAREYALNKDKARLEPFPGARRRPLRAKPGRAVTQ